MRLESRVDYVVDNIILFIPFQICWSNVIPSKMAEGIASILLLTTSMVIGLSSGNLGWEYIFIIFVLLELSDILLWLVKRDTEDISISL